MTKGNKSSAHTQLAAGLALALLSGGCSTHPAEEKAGINEVVDAPQALEKHEAMSRKDQISLSRQDLATRLGIELEEVSVSGATPVRWRSAALGCPEPDTNYLEMLVPGTLIMLRVGNSIYHYHSLRGAEPFFCPDDRVQPAYVGHADT